MRLYRWLLVPLLLSIFVGFVPAYAADPEPITDKGNNVYDVDGQLGDLPNILPGEEVDKIAALQAPQQVVQILSPISPDDEAVFGVEGDTPGFFNIQDGSFLPIDVNTTFQRFVPFALLSQSIGWGWRDDRRLTSIGAEIIDASTGDARPVLIYIDRLTGEVSADQIDFGNLPQGAVPINTSPDGTRLIIAAPPADGGDDSLHIKQVPVTWGRTSAEAPPTLSATLQHKIDALARTPYLREVQRVGNLLRADPNKFSMFEVAAEMLVYDAVNGEVHELRPIEAGTTLLSLPAWSQDSSKIAVTFTGIVDYHKNPDLRDVKAPFDGALISEQLYRDVTGNLPPARNPWLQDNTLETYDVNTGESQVLNARDGDGTLLYAGQWSTDGQTVMAQIWHPAKLVGRRYPIYTPQFVERSSFRFYNTELKEIRRLESPLVSGSLNVVANVVSPDEVIFRSTNGTNRSLYYYNYKSGDFHLIPGKAGNYGGLQATRLSHQVIFYYSSFTEPTELHRMNWDGSDDVALTDFNADLKAASDLRQDAVSFRLANGQVRTGVLVQPAGAAFPPKNTQVVVWQEGGPAGTMANFWNADVERPFALLPNMGIALLVVPLAGREGYGSKVYNSLYDSNNFGQLDIAEQAQIVQQMIAKGWTSKGKVGITGCSYGGYFTTQSIASYPDLYAAANDQCALVDTITEWSRGYDRLMPYLQGVPPWTNVQEYRRDSPLYNAGAIKTPLLTFKGTEDFLPITLNQNLHQQLFNNAVPNRMLNFVGAGHGIVSVASRSDGGDPITPDVVAAYERYAAQEMVLWFRTYLK